MKRTKIVLSTLIGALLVPSFMTSCTKKNSSSSSSESSALAITGGFSSVSVYSMGSNSPIQSFSATDYTMVCAMLTSPYTSDAESLSSDGSFSLSIAGGKGQPIGCFLTKSGSIVGVFEFETGASESGSALPVNTGTTSIQLPTDLALGTDGTVVVDVANVTQNSSTESAVTFEDPTGTWNITKACMNSIDSSTKKQKSECRLPSQTGGKIPSSVYLKLVTATNSSTSDVKRGLAIWKSEADRTACGDKEGAVDLPVGYTSDGGWDVDFSGGQTIDLSTTTKVDNSLVSAKIGVWPSGGGGGSSQTTCGITQKLGGGPLVDGETTCDELDYNSKTWSGMSDGACKLQCVLQAMSRDDDQVNYYDWGNSVACVKRYKMNWFLQNEFQNDRDFSGSGTQAGALADGKCDGAGDGCYDTINSALKPVLEVDDRGPKNRFMFGVFNTVGNVGTLIQKRNTGKNHFEGGIECGGTEVEKFTMVMSSATQAQVTVEHNFIPDADNNIACPDDRNFQSMSNRDESFTLQVTKQ